jgi:hypothetical protein
VSNLKIPPRFTLVGICIFRPGPVVHHSASLGPVEQFGRGDQLDCKPSVSREKAASFSFN